MAVEYATLYKYTVRQLCIKEAKCDIFLVLQYFSEEYSQTNQNIVRGYVISRKPVVYQFMHPQVYGKLSFSDHTLLWSW